MHPRSQSGLEWGRNRRGYFYILPWVIGFLCFTAYPVAYSALISMWKWDGVNEPTFVGLTNFINFIWPADLNSTRHVLFMRALKNNAMFMVFSVGGSTILAVLMAAVMNDMVPGHRIFRVLFFLPSLVIPIATGLMMRPIFLSGVEGGGPQPGLVNAIIQTFGGKPLNFLGDPNNAPWVLVGVNYWGVGATMIIFMAGIAGIPRSYFEAAELDGAGWWSRLYRITLPNIVPIITFQLIQGLIYSISIIDLAAALAGMGDAAGTNSNMGSNNSLATLVFYLYRRGWGDWRMGESAAIGWIVFILGFIPTLFIIIYLRRRAKASQGMEQV
jgi:multiple sugar transport system permease protein